ncbi:hypothetical protein AVEN_187873-1 [Araneus ventricosus]|uniref:Uncharacterized protein n=1 Tax=Araneus ventricosus TaxID=182803 RepID=A0A4Y2CTZ0_ARAVE|nr:hypothetical protein AVEN_187873-1 [Araneus ventricosus]
MHRISRHFFYKDPHLLSGGEINGFENVPCKKFRLRHSTSDSSLRLAAISATNMERHPPLTTSGNCFRSARVFNGLSTSRTRACPSLSNIPSFCG